MRLFRLKKSIIFWTLVFLFLTGVAARYLIWQPKSVPKDFIDARQRSYDVAQTIVKLSSDSLVDLSRMAFADQRRSYQDALAVVFKAIADNGKARVEAFKLSSALEVMSKNLQEISPFRAKDLATEALGYEVTLINHLLTYNDYLNQLLKVLQEKFNYPTTGNDEEIKIWINRINGEVEAINALNKKYNDTMIKFDRVFAK